MPDKLDFRRLTSETATTHRRDVESIYVASYVEAIAAGDPFDNVETFMYRFDRYGSLPDFDMVIAYVNGIAVGQAWGWPLDEKASTTGWWSGLIETPEPGLTTEDGRRTFALSEIMVDLQHQGKGIARALHDALLVERAETRATLLVELGNEKARRAYVHWGWQPVGHIRPGWDDAPLYEVMIHSLPLLGESVR